MKENNINLDEADREILGTEEEKKSTGAEDQHQE